MRTTVLWIDSRVARIVEIDGDEVLNQVFHREEPENHINPHTPRAGHYEHRFFHSVAHRLENTDGLIVLGPGPAKDQFVNHLQREHATLAARVLRVEPADHPSDAQLLDYARKAFQAHHPRV
jgi:stalled ribosome rescue protein Dom34